MTDLMIKVYLVSFSIMNTVLVILIYILIRAVIDMRDDIDRMKSWWPFVELCKLKLSPEEIESIQKTGKIIQKKEDKTDDDVR